MDKKRAAKYALLAVGLSCTRELGLTEKLEESIMNSAMDFGMRYCLDDVLENLAYDIIRHAKNNDHSARQFAKTNPFTVIAISVPLINLNSSFGEKIITYAAEKLESMQKNRSEQILIRIAEQEEIIANVITQEQFIFVASAFLELYAHYTTPNLQAFQWPGPLVYNPKNSDGRLSLDLSELDNGILKKDQFYRQFVKLMQAETNTQRLTYTYSLLQAEDKLCNLVSTASQANRQSWPRAMSYLDRASSLSFALRLANIAVWTCDFTRYTNKMPVQRQDNLSPALISFFGDN
jgi:hypothetical protein